MIPGLQHVVFVSEISEKMHLMLSKQKFYNYAAGTVISRNSMSYSKKCTLYKKKFKVCLKILTAQIKLILKNF